MFFFFRFLDVYYTHGYEFLFYFGMIPRCFYDWEVETYFDF